MALETLKGVKEIGGFQVLQGPAGVDWSRLHELRETYPVYVDDDLNAITFKIQNGPIKEHGVNGCQVDTMIEAAKLIIEGLNKKFYCDENAEAITNLELALASLARRRANREKRGVEGTSAP